MVDPDKPKKCKVGITKNPDNRLRSYRTASPQCYFEEIYNIPDKIHEKNLLYELSGAFIVDHEYIHADPKLIKNIVESYFDDNDIDY